MSLRSKLRDMVVDRPRVPGAESGPPSSFALSQAVKAVQNYENESGPGVGDFVVLGGVVRRIAYVWRACSFGSSECNARVQFVHGGELDGSYYFSTGGYFSFSGGLDDSVDLNLVLVAERPGVCWSDDFEGRVPCREWSGKIISN